jgi:tetratricopeptide (TPR) repeat protein
MSTFRIGPTTHVTFGNDGIDSKVDSFMRDLLAQPGDPLEIVTDALRDTLIYFAEADIEAEDQAAAEQADEDDARTTELEELEARVKTAEDRLEVELQKVSRLQTRCQELLSENAALRITERDGETVDLDVLIQENPNVVRAAFGDNKSRAYKLHCEASQIDEQNPHDAERLYRRALSLDPKSALTWTNLGSCMHRLDRPERALECYRRAVEIEPRQAEAHFNIATVLLLDKGDCREVELQLKLAIDCEPRFADAYYTLGAMYVRKADAKNAKLYLEQFLRLDPKSIYANDVREMLKGER